MIVERRFKEFQTWANRLAHLPVSISYTISVTKKPEREMVIIDGIRRVRYTQTPVLGLVHLIASSDWTGWSMGQPPVTFLRHDYTTAPLSSLSASDDPPNAPALVTEWARGIAHPGAWGGHLDVEVSPTARIKACIGLDFDNARNQAVQVVAQFHDWNVVGTEQRTVFLVKTAGG